MTADWPEITYDQALAAHQAGQKIHKGGRIFLIRPTPRDEEGGPVLWVADERTLGDHGLLLFPDGRIEAR